MAEYQINPVKNVYVSTGGTPTKGQIKGMLEETRQANHYLGFDKDEAGRGFVKNFKTIAKEMGFTDFTVQAFHPLGQYKDWVCHVLPIQRCCQVWMVAKEERRDWQSSVRLSDVW